MDFEFYETPKAYTRWLGRVLAQRGTPISGEVFEPCVGTGAIVSGLDLHAMEFGVATRWITNDLDPRWPADYHGDATSTALWTAATDNRQIDWTVSNTPFTPAVAIISRALQYSRVGVAMHLRASIHEVLKTGIRRTWMREHTPTGILWLPRFAYQRSKTTGDWTTDSVTACWCVWLKDPNARQFIEYAPEQVLDELKAEEPLYRARMDQLMDEYRKRIA